MEFTGTRMMRSLEAQRILATRRPCMKPTARTPDRTLCDAGGSGECGDVPVLGSVGRYYRTHIVIDGGRSGSGGAPSAARR